MPEILRVGHPFFNKLGFPPTDCGNDVLLVLVIAD